MSVDPASPPPLRHDLELPGSGPPRRVVVLGDSAAAGHGLDDPEVALARRVARGLAAGGHRVVLRSVAVDGAKTVDVLRHQLPAVDGAEVVVIGVGANDALRGRRAARVEGHTSVLLRGVARRAPDARVLLLTCPDLSAAPRVPALLRPLVGWRCRVVARVQETVAARHGVPTVTVPRSRLGPEVFGADGFHPGVVGHERLAVRVLELLEA